MNTSLNGVNHNAHWKKVKSQHILYMPDPTRAHVLQMVAMQKDFLSVGVKSVQDMVRIHGGN